MSKTIFSKAGAYFALIARQINARSEPVSAIKHRGVIPGGFPYSAFNGGAKVKPEAILNTVENTRALVFNRMEGNEHSFLDVDKVYQHYFMFINASTMQVDKRLYNLETVKGPLQFNVELEHVGKTSSQIKTDIYLENESHPIVVSRVSTVFVCNKTRVPKSPPEWWVEKYKSRISKTDKSIGRLEFLGGDNSRTTETPFKIPLSDVDAYRHTNWSNYVRYCHEAFGKHRISQVGIDGCEEFFHRGVKDFSILFRKESSVDDLITVKVSPDKEKASDADNVFYFRIENESNDVICESKIEYYPSSV